MELLETVINALVVGTVGAVLGFMVHGLRREVRAEMAALRAEFKQDIAELRRKIGELRSDLTRVALAVGTEPPGATAG